MRPLLIYIHGFKSSPQSQKACELAEHIHKHQLDLELLTPALPNYPGESYRQLEALLKAQLRDRQVGLVGSSLGGFMATVLAEKFYLRAALVNPAVRPYLLIEEALGEHENPYTGEQFFLHQGHVDELRALEQYQLHYPQNLYVMLQAGDETLNYRHAVDYYDDCLQLVEQGGDHRFQGFDRHLPEMLKFLQLS